MYGVAILIYDVVVIGFLVKGIKGSVKNVKEIVSIVKARKLNS